MLDIEQYKKRIFSMSQDEHESIFEELAIQAFDFQRENCPIYREYLRLVNSENIFPTSIKEIPFLPISVFKNKMVVSSVKPFEDENEFLQLPNSKIFTSSATSSMQPSRHFVCDLKLYEESFLRGFEQVYGDIEKYNILALLPSYLERKGSSLVYMVNYLIDRVIQGGGEGGFYLYNHDDLLKKLIKLNSTDSSDKRKTILFGVSFALLDFGDFVEQHCGENSSIHKIMSLFV